MGGGGGGGRSGGGAGGGGAGGGGGGEGGGGGGGVGREKQMIQRSNAVINRSITHNLELKENPLQTLPTHNYMTVPSTALFMPSHRCS